MQSNNQTALLRGMQTTPLQPSPDPASLCRQVKGPRTTRIQRTVLKLKLFILLVSLACIYCNVLTSELQGACSIRLISDQSHTFTRSPGAFIIYLPSVSLVAIATAKFCLRLEDLTKINQRSLIWNGVGKPCRGSSHAGTTLAAHTTCREKESISTRTDVSPDYKRKIPPCFRNIIWTTTYSQWETATTLNPCSSPINFCSEQTSSVSS